MKPEQWIKKWITVLNDTRNNIHEFTDLHGFQHPTRNIIHLNQINSWHKKPAAASQSGSSTFALVKWSHLHSNTNHNTKAFLNESPAFLIRIENNGISPEHSRTLSFILNYIALTHSVKTVTHNITQSPIILKTINLFCIENVKRLEIPTPESVTRDHVLFRF